MRTALIAAAATFALLGAAAAQSVGGDAPPRRIGNHANGFNYQPTPGEVIPKEKIVGVRPSRAAQGATNEQLETADRKLLEDEGLSTSSVPRMTPR